MPPSSDANVRSIVGAIASLGDLVIDAAAQIEQRGARVKVGVVQDACDLRERQAKLATEKDVLKAQHFYLPVIAVAILPTSGFSKPIWS